MLVQKRNLLELFLSFNWPGISSSSSSSSGCCGSLTSSPSSAAPSRQRRISEKCPERETNCFCLYWLYKIIWICLPCRCPTPEPLGAEGAAAAPDWWPPPLLLALPTAWRGPSRSGPPGSRPHPPFPSSASYSNFPPEFKRRFHIFKFIFHAYARKLWPCSSTRPSRSHLFVNYFFKKKWRKLQRVFANLPISLQHSPSKTHWPLGTEEQDGTSFLQWKHDKMISLS